MEGAIRTFGELVRSAEMAASRQAETTEIALRWDLAQKLAEAVGLAATWAAVKGSETSKTDPPGEVCATRRIRTPLDRFPSALISFVPFHDI